MFKLVFLLELLVFSYTTQESEHIRHALVQASKISPGGVKDIFSRKLKQCLDLPASAIFMNDYIEQRLYSTTICEYQQTNLNFGRTCRSPEKKIEEPPLVTPYLLSVIPFFLSSIGNHPCHDSAVVSYGFKIHRRDHPAQQSPLMAGCYR